jgi:hypothetical protein
MSVNKQNAADRAQAIADSWEEYAPTAKFAGMTLAEYRTATQGSTQGRKDKGSLKMQVKGKTELIVVSDSNTRQVNKKVVAAVIADPAFGDDCPLYAAIGLVPASQRASGLTRHNGNGNGNSQPPNS